MTKVGREEDKTWKDEETRILWKTTGQQTVSSPAGSRPATACDISSWEHSHVQKYKLTHSHINPSSQIALSAMAAEVVTSLLANPYFRSGWQRQLVTNFKLPKFQKTVSIWYK